MTIQKKDEFLLYVLIDDLFFDEISSEVKINVSIVENIFMFK